MAIGRPGNTATASKGMIAKGRLPRAYPREARTPQIASGYHTSDLLSGSSAGRNTRTAFSVFCRILSPCITAAARIRWAVKAGEFNSFRGEQSPNHDGPSLKPNIHAEPLRLHPGSYRKTL